MISIERGLEIVMSAAVERDGLRGMPAEYAALSESLGRVLREDLLSAADSPPFDKSIRDGFAVRHEDVRQVPVVLSVVGESRAGAGSDRAVGPGQTCEIMTGAPVPAGADAVVMVEHTERLSPSSVRILRIAAEGHGLLKRGAEAKEGERLLEAGRLIDLAAIGLLSSAGKSQVLVSRKPRVAILATGDELVELDETPAHGQIRNSNSYTLHAQTIRAGGEPVLLGIAKDTREDLRDKVRRGLDHDLLLVSGGVSMGKYDFVEDVFAEFEVRVLFDQVAMKPGKPTVFGYHDKAYVFGLPGNPVSTMVAFQMFVRPLIHFLLKAKNAPAVILEAVVERSAKCDPQRASVTPALVRMEHGSYRIATAPWKGSADLAGLARANALIMIPQREGSLEPGDIVRFLFME